jgi:RHS repeat-associated protein
MYPSGYMAQNRYTSWTGEIDRVAERTGSGIGAVHWQATSRNADGQIAGMSVGNQTTSKGYDGFGRVSSIQTGGGTLQNGSYGFDALGNLTSRSDTPAGQSSQSLGYDVLNRLTTSGGVTVATYSATGNILTRNGVTYTTPATSHRLTSAGSTGYGYDADGNVTAITGGGNNRTVTPNAFNLPTTISSSTASLSYVYDGSHARIKETSTTGAGTATTYYLGGYEEHTRADGVLEVRHYLATPEGIVGIVTLRGDGTSDLRYWHKDHLGSVAVVVDQTGAVKQKYAFDAWGNRSQLSQSDPTPEVRSYTGHELLPEVGIVHMNGRLYDPSTGRMLSADPLVQDPFNGQNYNRYSYVLNNPLSYTDPTGFSFWTKWRRPILAIAAAAFAQWAIP